jgi:hypothetical protein
MIVAGSMPQQLVATIYRIVRIVGMQRVARQPRDNLLQPATVKSMEGAMRISRAYGSILFALLLVTLVTACTTQAEPELRTYGNWKPTPEGWQGPPES